MASVVRPSIHDVAVTVVHPAVEELAEREGLVCFDPQRSWVRLPSAMDLMQMYGGAVAPVTTPDLETIAQAVATTAENIATSSLKRERNAMSSSAKPFAVPSGNLPEVADIFVSYARGNEEWRHSYAWERFQL